MRGRLLASLYGPGSHPPGATLPFCGLGSSLMSFLVMAWELLTMSVGTLLVLGGLWKWWHGDVESGLLHTAAGTLLIHMVNHP